MEAIDQSIKLRPIAYDQSQPIAQPKVWHYIKSEMRARTIGARGRVVQNCIREAHVFLLTRAPWGEPNG